MKVLSTGDYGGAISNNIAQFELLIGLKRLGVDLIIVAKFNPEVLKRFTDEGIICIQDFPTSKIDFDYINNIKKYISTYKIDILHVFHGKTLRNCIIAAKHLPVRLITYMGSTSIHWHDPSAYLTYLSPRVDKIICNSDFVYKHVKKQYFGNHKKKAIRIYKGYNPDWFINSIPYDFSSLGIKKSDLIVCLAANYLKVKGIKYFIKSTYHINKELNIHFLLLGDMRGNKEIPLLIEKSPLKENIHSLGSRTDITSYFKSSDIYVQTSNKEGFGRAISEAMCSKKPIIMTNAGGCTELIDKNSGIIVPRKNPKEIARAIEYLAKHPTLRKSMGENSYNRIKNHYSIENTIQETLAVYKYQILQKNKV